MLTILTCPICKVWTTTKINDEGSVFSKHLVKVHDIHLTECIKQFPELSYIKEHKKLPAELKVRQQEARIKSMLEKHGCHTSQLKSTKDKNRKTKLERYGDETYNNTNKSSVTNLERYGVERPGQSVMIQEKMQSTNLKRYGNKNASKTELIKQRIKDTNLERYGVSCTFQLPSQKEKTIITSQHKYGFDNPSSSPQVKLKRRDTVLARYGVNNPIQDPEILQKNIKSN